jgi:hypothetical protein
MLYLIPAIIFVALGLWVVADIFWGKKQLCHYCSGLGFRHQGDEHERCPICGGRGEL